MGKKILLATRPLSPPWDEASKNFAFNLAIRIPDYEIHILTSQKMEGLPPNVVQKKLYTSNDFNLYQKMALLSFLYAYRADYDLIHYLFTPTKLNSLLIKTLVKHPGAKSIQTVATLRDDLFSKSQIRQMLFADKIATYSDNACSKLKAMGFDNVRRVYPGIDLSYFSPAPKDPAMLEFFGLKETDFTATYPGEYVRLGATDMIIDSFIDYWKRNAASNVKLIMACRVKNAADETKKGEIIRKLEKANMMDRVIFTDTVRDMAKLYNLSDVVLFPVSNMSGKFDVPLAIIEAYACKKPVILSNLEVYREFSRGTFSVTIEKGNGSRLIGAVEECHNNGTYRQSLGENARRYAEENFSIGKAVEEYKKMYDELLGT